MAEGGGFEPPVDLRLHNLSKVAPSTTRTPFQAEKVLLVYRFPPRKSTGKFKRVKNSGPGSAGARVWPGICARCVSPVARGLACGGSHARAGIK